MRLTTMEVTFPRIVLAEFNTHRALSRNSASSRAIPVRKLIERVETNPFVPERFPVNGKGMKPTEWIGPGDPGFEAAREVWLKGARDAVSNAKLMSGSLIHPNGIHKQIVNRLLEPWLWHTVIVSATDWDNFFTLRAHTDAQGEINKIAVMMRHALLSSIPRAVSMSIWHLPLIGFDGDGEFTLDQAIKISAARCARVSYLTHDGRRDPDEDLRLFRDLSHADPKHLSPLEHPAQASNIGSGNYKGWRQLRHYAENDSLAYLSVVNDKLNNLPEWDACYAWTRALVKA